MKKLMIAQSMLVLLWTNCVVAGAGNWSNVPIFNQAPLEVKLGTFTDDMNSDLLTMVLWNDGGMNRLDAVRVPFPYNGSNVTSISLEATPTLFSLGDICRMGSNLIVPYIKNFNVEIALYNGNNWSSMTIPETLAHSFDSADCAVSQNGVFVSAHDFDDSEIELFKFNQNTSSFSVFGQFGGGGTPATDIAGPFNGGVRDTLVVGRDESSAITMNQGFDGMIRTTHFDTSVITPLFTHNNIAQEPVPNGFTFVKESFGSRQRGLTVFGYNANSRAQLIEVLDTNPESPLIHELGAINNTGSQFSFQGGAVLGNPDGIGNAAEIFAEWDKFYSYETESMEVEIDNDYPLQGVGGPVANCRRAHNAFSSEIYVAGPRVGSAGTDFHIKEIESPDVIFNDGFESGDTSSWSNCQ